jgi:hypothetical protein
VSNPEDVAAIARWLIDAEYPETKRALEKAEQAAWEQCRWMLQGAHPRQFFTLAWSAGVNQAMMDPDIVTMAMTLEKFLRDRLDP